ncbi:hypothetical protein V1525DRAFT_400532 [Lipomyces kononenkoae]|uniref:Uncharacterized protein n=1 Tax=Lipomyces kononenkoae TaxID=34357 RepID=A0ACC3T3Y7_LIPKO
MDAACGPSTPLRAFQKHARADRSLQQERFVSQPSSSAPQHTGPSTAGAEFRTGGQREGNLDGEYAAFLSSQRAPTAGVAGPSSDLISGDLASMTLSDQHHFEEMVYANEQDHLAYRPQPRLEQARLSSPTTSWEQDFMQFLDAPLNTSLAVPQESAKFGGYAPMMMRQSQPFAYAHQTLSLPEQVVSPSRVESSRQDQAFMEEFDRIHEAISLQDDDEEQTVEDVDQQEDDDGLAAIAGELLESLKSDQTQKFKDSTFLALMRRLRDKEVVVQGNKMVEVVNNGEYAKSYASGDGAMSSPFESAQKELGMEGKFRTGAWEESF